MRVGLFVILLVFAGKYSPADAQSKWINPYNPADSVAAIDLLHLGDAHFTASRYDSAFYYYDKTEEFSLQKKFYRGYMEAIYGKGGAYYSLQEYEKAEGYVRTAMDEARRMNDLFLYAYGLGELARIRMRTDRLEEAIACFSEAIETHFSKVPSTEGSEMYGDLAFTYGLRGQYDKEIEYRIKSIEIVEKHFAGEDRFLGVKYSNLGIAYFKNNNREKSIEYLKKAVVIREKYGQIAGLAATYGNLSKVYLDTDPKEAERYLVLCEKNAIQSREPRWMAFYYSKAMDFYRVTQQLQTAMTFQQKAIELLEKTGKDPAELGRGYLNMAVLARQNGIDTAAVAGYFSKCHTIIRQTTTNQKVNLRDYYQELSRFHQEQGKYKDAYEEYRSYISYQDSLTNAKTKRDFAEITVRYETAKKDAEIAKLNAERLIKELRLQKQEAIISGNLAEAARKQKEIDLLANEQTLRTLKLNQQKEELERHRLLARNNAQQLQLARQQKQFADNEVATQKKLINTQKQLRNIALATVFLVLFLAVILFNRYQLKKKIEQQEVLLSVRNDIAKNLHDEIGSTLTSIKILSEASVVNLRKNQEKAAVMMEKITEQSAEMQQGMSDIVWAVSPDNDKVENMLIRMREYTSRTLEPREIKTTFRIGESVPAQNIGMQQRKDFFLIFKEAITNIAKYADARTVVVTLSRENTEIVLQITDDGRGFDTAQSTAGNGLRNMKQRAEGLGGTFVLHTIPQKGTTVTVRVPAA